MTYLWYSNKGIYIIILLSDAVSGFVIHQYYY